MNSSKKTWKKKRKPRGENSFVAPHALFEFQLALSFFVKTILKMNRNLELDLRLPIYLV